MVIGDSSDWKDRCYGLQHERNELARKCTEQESLIISLKTKCTKLENFYKQETQKGSPSFFSSKPSSQSRFNISDVNHKSEKEYKDFLNEVTSRNSCLQKDLKALEAKYKSAVKHIQKQKKEIDTWKRRFGSSNISSKISKQATRSIVFSSIPFSKRNIPTPQVIIPSPTTALTEVESNKNTDEMHCKLKELESTLNDALKENHTLKQRLESTKNIKELQNDQLESYKETELDSTRLKLQLLQTRYNHLESKSKSQSELQECSIKQLEECNKKINDLQTELQNSKLQVIKAEERRTSSYEQKEYIQELVQQNNFLELQLTSLCQSPIVKSVDKANEIRELRKENRNLLKKTQEMEGHSRTMLSKCKVLQAKVNQLSFERKMLLQKFIEDQQPTDHQHNYEKERKFNKIETEEKKADISFDYQNNVNQ